MPECPHCGKWFRSNKGLKQHITKVHTVDTPLGRVFDPSTIDPIEAMERRAKRAKRRNR
ncbi:MAG: hypothetical protein DRO98_08185 [Archaeoglobales archaeon]|nr:MAG: hypothetical protein DRO98_08185 [Archaeoglobales archaeon]